MLTGAALALAALFPAAATAQQVTTTLTATADTYMRSNQTGNNFGTQTSMQVEPGARQALLQFNLSSVPAGIVMSATLRVWVSAAGTGAVGVHRATAAWTETGATWGNMAANYNAASEASGAPPTAGQYQTFDVTTLVRAWRSGTTNNGVMLVGASGATQTTYSSREVAAQAPQLVIVTNGNPSYSVSKLSTVVSDPANGTTQPKRMPGAVVEYSVTVSSTNANVSDNNSIALVEAVPAQASLYVGDLGGGGSGPVSFTNGPPSSGLTYTAATDLSFSINGGASWGYTPVPDANGYDSLVTHLRIAPKGTFAGSTGSGDPRFSYTFRAKNK